MECLFRAKLSVTTRLMGLVMCATFVSVMNKHLTLRPFLAFVTDGIN